MLCFSFYKVLFSNLDINRKIWYNKNQRNRVREEADKGV